jgi:hypothetical protein
MGQDRPTQLGLSERANLNHRTLQKTTTFQRLDLSPFSGRWRRIDLLSWARQKELVQWLRLALSDGPNWLSRSILPHPPEDRDRSSLRNVVVFCKTSTYQTMDRVQKKPNSSVQHTPSSESFQVYSLSCSQEIAIGPQLKPNKPSLLSHILVCHNSEYSHLFVS